MHASLSKIWTSERLRVKVEAPKCGTYSRFVGLEGRDKCSLVRKLFRKPSKLVLYFCELVWI